MADGVASPRPINPAERIDAIDVLRGIALLGVMAINIIFRVSIFERFLPQHPYASLLDRTGVFSAGVGCNVTATGPLSGYGAR